MYGRRLLFNCPLVHNDHMMDQRKAIIQDPHSNTLSLSTHNMNIQVGSCYAVDYINNFYYGRVTSMVDDIVKLKFLHAVPADLNGKKGRIRTKCKRVAFSLGQ